MLSKLDREDGNNINIKMKKQDETIHIEQPKRIDTSQESRHKILHT